MWRVIQPDLGKVWNQIPPGIIVAESAIELFQFFVSLRPRNNQAELKALRNTVMDAGLPDSEIKPVRDLRHMCDTLRTLSRAIGEYENRSQTEATETTYAARLIDVLGRIYAPVASKPGSTGGTLSQALSSRCTLKQVREPDAQLNWREIMETCIRFADENAAQQPVTSMLANSLFLII